MHIPKKVPADRIETTRDSLDVETEYPVAELLSGLPNVIIQLFIWMIPEMVPVSYPKSMPPKAAKAVIAMPEIPAFVGTTVRRPPGEAVVIAIVTLVGWDVMAKGGVCGGIIPAEVTETRRGRPLERARPFDVT